MKHHTSPSLQRLELDYSPDSTRLFETLRDLPYPMLFDSGPLRGAERRYDFFMADPINVIEVSTTQHSPQTFWDHLQTQVTQQRQRFKKLHAVDESQDVPRNIPVGGWFGFLSYDFGACHVLGDRSVTADIALPQSLLAEYPWIGVVDHKKENTFLYSLHDDIDLAVIADRCQTPPKHMTSGAFSLKSPFKPDISREHYGEAFERIQAYIHAGDCYQVNLAQRLSAQCQGDPWLAYCAMRTAHPAPFSAYLQTPQGSVLSTSPERFIRCQNKGVITQPIKGTRPRVDDAFEDAAARQALTNSEKDRAENLMIVDLMRNDLGRVCRTGSVEVTRAFDIKSFSAVHHMVSTIEGQLADGLNEVDLLHETFPGGSITGAPKMRAMEIINELEPYIRSAYCGAIGYIGYNAVSDWNIAIRTAVHSNDNITLWGGSGLVADSDQQAEYQECMDKIAPLCRVLENL